MKRNFKGMLSIFVMAILALEFAISFVSVSADLTEPDLDKTSVQVGDTITVSGYPGDVISGATIKIYWDVAINAWLLNTTTGNPDGSYDVEITVPNTLNGTHYVWVEDTVTGFIIAASITVDSEIDTDVSSGLPGDDLEVTGTGFGDEQPVNITMYNQTLDAVVVDYRDSIDTDEFGTFVVTFEIPSILDYGIYTINATDGYNVAEVNFTVGATIALSPDEGPEGTVIEVSGRGFDSSVTLSLGSVTWDGTYSMAIVGDAADTDLNGEFTLDVVAPSWGEGDWKIEVSDVTNQASADFTIDGRATIEVSPTYGSPGAIITVTGYNFTRIAGIEVYITMDSVPVSDLVTAETYANGSFEGIFVSPAVSFTTYTVTALDEYDIGATDAFKVGLIALIINPTSGEAGTEIAITGIGFTQGTYHLTFGDELYADHGTVSAVEAISDNFYIPNVDPGVYTLTVIDTDENEVTVQFTVTESTYVSMDPTLGPNDYNVSIEGINFADKVSDVDFVLYNSTDDWLMDVWEDSAGSVPASTDIDGNFTGWWMVLDEGTLSLGDYTVNVTGTEGLLVQVPFSVVAARVEVAPRNALFDRGDTITFDISNDFAAPDSYIEIYSPDDTLYWKTEKFDAWLKVGTLYTVPYYLQTSGMNPMILSPDAPLGTWFWVFYEEGTTQLVNGTFAVGYIDMTINPTSGSAGTEVALTVIGFKTGESWIITFDDEQLSVSWDIDDSGEIVITYFFVPSASPGEYNIALVTESGLRYNIVFTVTDETRIILDQPKVQPGALLWIRGENFASGLVVDVNLNIGSIPVGKVWTDAEGSFSQTVAIPDLPDGTYRVTAIQGEYLIGAEAIIQIQRAKSTAEPRKDSYFPGEAIRFDIQSVYPEEGSYIQIRDPPGNSYFVTDPFSEDVWITFESIERVPVFSQTAEGNPMILPADAPLGEWGWTWYDGRRNVLDFGSFMVVSGQPTADIDTPSDTTFYKSEGIEFRGHGTDPDGRIKGYRWEIDGLIMSEQDSFTTSFEESGTQAVLFSVMDQDGIWSEPVTLSLDIKPWIIKINDFYVQSEHVVVTTGAGATAATGVAISQLPKPTPKKIRKIHKKKELKRQKKEERRNKKKKGKPFIFWSIAGSDFLYNRNGEISIKLYNVGFAKAKNVSIDLYCTFGLKLEKTHISIPELGVQKKDEVTIGFQLMPFARNGLYKIVARINTRTLLEERKVHFITILKTGLLLPLQDDNQDKIIEWLNKTEYHWSPFTNPENYVNLMEYDLILITNSELSKKSVNNLNIHTRMGNNIVVNDRVRKREREFLDLLGYREIDREEVKVKTSNVRFATSDHPLLKGVNIDSLKKEAEFLTMSHPKIGAGNIISTANYVRSDGTVSLPLLTENKIQDGRVIHINYEAHGGQKEIPSITKNILDYLLKSIYTTKKIPSKGRSWKK